MERLFASAGVPVPPGFLEGAAAHLELVYRWNKVHDLTAVKAPDAPERHVLDAILPFASEPPPRTVLDIGSGAGFPGIPLALYWRDAQVTLCEPLRKRRSFLETVAGQLNLSCTVVGEPAEQLTGTWDMVTSRATLPWRELVDVGTRLLAPGGRLIALLGPDQCPSDEEARALGGEVRAYQLPSGARRNVFRLSKRST